MERTRWTERKFHFDFPEGWIYNILERLRGTVIRIEAMTKDMPDDLLSFMIDDKWSIKQHIGHLSDLEDLHEGRINDFQVRKEILRAADMQNLQTERANHNQQSLSTLIAEFEVKRNRIIHRFGQLDDDTLYFTSLHPRLQVLMRPVDMAYFMAEHDDHHLASMRINMMRQIRI